MKAANLKQILMRWKQWISYLHCYLDGKSHVYCEKTTVFGRLLMMDSVQIKMLVRALPYGAVRMDEPSPFVVS